MGGKAALYAVAHNIGNLADKVAMVVTSNSPIKKLSNYYFTARYLIWVMKELQLILPDQEYPALWSTTTVPQTAYG